MLGDELEQHGRHDERRRGARVCGGVAAGVALAAILGEAARQLEGKARLGK